MCMCVCARAPLHVNKHKNAPRGRDGKEECTGPPSPPPRAKRHDPQWTTQRAQRDCKRISGRSNALSVSNCVQAKSKLANVLRRHSLQGLGMVDFFPRKTFKPQHRPAFLVSHLTIFERALVLVCLSVSHSHAHRRPLLRCYDNPRPRPRPTQAHTNLACDLNLKQPHTPKRVTPFGRQLIRLPRANYNAAEQDPPPSPPPFPRPC